MKTGRDRCCDNSRGIVRTLSIILAFVLISACSSIGPRTINRDQLDYGRSIGQNWKNQMLANLVRLRYVDMPIYLDVGQIVAGYTLETQLSGGLGYGTAFDSSNTASLGASGRFTDRPTITYTPKTGTEYLASLLTPIKPSSLLVLIQSGYDATRCDMTPDLAMIVLINRFLAIIEQPKPPFNFRQAGGVGSAQSDKVHGGLCNAGGRILVICGNLVKTDPIETIQRPYRRMKHQFLTQ